MRRSGPILLPVHGFVLAGGKSSRMGRDKAMLDVRGRPMVAGAVEVLASFCEKVSISGNREDLSRFAPVVGEARIEAGPAAGIEAGLRSSLRPWTVFVPVDVPMVPGTLMRRWIEAVLRRERDGVRLSFLRAGGERQPTFCSLQASCAGPFTAVMESDERKLGRIFDQVAAEIGPESLWLAEAEEFMPMGDGPAPDVAALFGNINTPEDLARLARSLAGME